MKQELAEALHQRHGPLLGELPHIPCGDGWFNLLDCLFEALSGLSDAIPGGIRIDEVKSKYGSLRVYLAGTSTCAEALVQLAEGLSERTCEICGASGSRVDKGSWTSTLCATHQATRNS